MQTILVVDDSATIRRMVKASLQSLTSSFVEATSGLEAIEVLAVGSVDAIVLDLNMPDMHGIDVLRFIRSHGQTRAVPVLVLTTRGDAGSRDAAVQAGASAYMTKPFSAPALADAVKELLADVDARPAR